MEILADFDSPDAEHRLPEVAEADVFLRRLALVIDADFMAAHEHGGQLGVVSRVHGAAAAPNKQVVVERAAVAFLHSLKQLDKGSRSSPPDTMWWPPKSRQKTC